MEKTHVNEHEDCGETASPAPCITDTQEDQRLVRKIDLHLLPCIWVMYLFSYMDRTNIGNAKVAGMSDDLKMDSTQYSIALVVFFTSYVVFEVPSNMILSGTRPSIYLSIIMIVWGLVTIGMAFVPSYSALIGFRFVMGLLESGFAPGVLMLLSTWYKKEEQSKRFAVFISAAILSGAFGGLLAGAITSNLENVHGIRGWRWLFIVEGAATVVVAVIAAFVLPDFPENTPGIKFSERERCLAIKRLRAEREPLAACDQGFHINHWSAMRISLASSQTWLFVMGYMAIVGSSTLSYFYPTLVSGLGYHEQLAQFMTVPIFAVAFFATAVTGYLGDKKPAWRGLILAFWMSISMLCAVIACVVYNFRARYALLVIMASGLWASNGLALSYASVAFAAMSAEVRAISLAFINAMGNLAQIYGAYLFPSDNAPNYIIGFGVISGMCLLGVLAYVSLFWLLKKDG